MCIFTVPKIVETRLLHVSGGKLSRELPVSEYCDTLCNNKMGCSTYTYVCDRAGVRAVDSNVALRVIPAGPQ